MRKKILFGVIAAALVVLNVAVFSASSVAAPPEPPATYMCYQTYSYCKEGGSVVLRPNCTWGTSSKRCRDSYCVTCFPKIDPGAVVHDIADLSKDPFWP